MSFYPPPIPAEFEPVIVARDTPCRKCQYNLRGLSSEGRCPECGSAVGLSLRGDLIRYSDPEWVGTLRLGISLILWAVVMFIMAAVVTALTRTSPRNASLQGMLANLAGSVVYLLGAWHLTTPDPSGLGEEKYGTSRKIIRVTMLSGLMQQVLALAIHFAPLPPPFGSILLGLNGVLSLVGTAGTFATLRYLSKLSLRIPDDALAARGELLTWLLGVPLVLIILIGIVLTWGIRSGGRTLRGNQGLVASLSCGAGLCALVMIVAGIMYLIFLEKLKRRLQAQMQLAWASWAGAHTQAK